VDKNFQGKENIFNMLAENVCLGEFFQVDNFFLTQSEHYLELTSSNAEVQEKGK